MFPSFSSLCHGLSRDHGFPFEFLVFVRANVSREPPIHPPCIEGKDLSNSIDTHAFREHPNAFVYLIAWQPGTHELKANPLGQGSNLGPCEPEPLDYVFSCGSRIVLEIHTYICFLRPYELCFCWVFLDPFVFDRHPTTPSRALELLYSLTPRYNKAFGRYRTPKLSWLSWLSWLSFGLPKAFMLPYIVFFLSFPAPFFNFPLYGKQIYLAPDSSGIKGVLKHSGIIFKVFP